MMYLATIPKQFVDSSGVPYSGNTPLRAISFGFQNLTEVGNFLSQWIGGIIECDEDESISFTIKRISGSLNANLGISNFFIHKV